MQNINEKQIESLKKVANEAATHSSTALSKLIGIPVTLKMANTRILEIERLTAILAKPEESVYAVILPVKGENNTGSSALISSIGESYRLAELLLKRPKGSIKELDALSLSAITEASNIIGGSFLTVLSNKTGISLVQSPPQAFVDTIQGVIGKTIEKVDKTKQLSVAFETDFELSTDVIDNANEKIITHYIFLLEVTFAQKLLDALASK